MRRECEGRSLGVGSIPADRRIEGEKIFFCVTMRRRNLGFFNGLRRRLGSLAALFLGLGMPGSDLDVLTMPGLPLRCTPATNLVLTLRILAVALVIAPWLVFTSTAFT